jgi:hypothetical protein
VGAAVSGWIIDAAGARQAYLVAVGCGLLTALVALVARPQLVPAPKEVG